MAEMARVGTRSSPMVKIMGIRKSPMGKAATRNLQTTVEGTKRQTAEKAGTRSLMAVRPKGMSQALAIRVVGTKAVALAEQHRVESV